MEDLKNTTEDTVYKIGCATVRIHGKLERDNVETSTINFLKNVLRRKNIEKKSKTSGKDSLCVG